MSGLLSCFLVEVKMNLNEFSRLEAVAVQRENLLVRSSPDSYDVSRDRLSERLAAEWEDHHAFDR